MSYRTRTAIAQGKELGPESSASKLANALLRSEMADYSLVLAGPGGMLLDGEGATDDGEWASGFLFSRASRIGGGTDEVQRNVISERVLGMPREPSDDRVVPFSELATRRGAR
jgi:alkylation response protein AidB-like acyl-CoA dehydrogenase